MKKLVFSAAVIAAFAISACGGKGSDVSVSNVCDCMKLKDKYNSKDEAIKDLGEEKFKEIDEKCTEFRKNATDEEMDKCE